MGEKVRIIGQMQFERLLRIDGYFEGKLISNGSLIVGPTGVVVGNVTDMDEVLCDGKIVGNISVRRCVLRHGNGAAARVHGDISCKRLLLAEGVTVCGELNVHDKAPAHIDDNVRCG